MAPAATVVPPAAVPSALFTAATSVPTVTFVAPPYVLLPERVKVPIPCFVRPPVPLITPEKMVEELSPPAVRMPVPSVTLPAPASEPIVSLKLFRLNVAPPTTVRALVSAMRLAAPSVSVPTFTFVAPI